MALLDTQEVDHKWGLCGKHLNNWFPYDSKRDLKKKFIEIVLKGEKIRPSITPDDPDLVFGLIWEYHTKEGQEYLSECSNSVKESRMRPRQGKENGEARKEEIKALRMSEVRKEDPMDRVSSNR